MWKKQWHEIGHGEVDRLENVEEDKETRKAEGKNYKAFRK